MSLTLKKLTVSIGDKEIIHGLNITINPGEIHAIMGPNGSGKSTLAYTLAGHPLYTVDPKAKILLDKKDILPLSPDERAKHGLFLSFQYPTEIPGVSVQNFLRAMWEARFGPVGPENRFKTVLELRDHFTSVAKSLHIPKTLLQRNLNEGFSGGERKRVEILQMALFEPQYAVLDETDSGLDIDAVKVVARGAQKIVEEFQTGTVIITHYQRILKYIQPHFVHVFVNGKIVESGGPELAKKLEKSGYAAYTTEKEA